MRQQFRSVVLLLVGTIISCATSADCGSGPQGYSLAPFIVEVTPPIGHPCMGGGIAPVKKIDDPLFANGFVFQGVGNPVVLVAVDWCEIRNDAYERWRTVLADAAKTDVERVLVTSLHQHDAPIADLEAQRLLDKAGARGKICDLDFHERTVQRVAAALCESLKRPRTITHVGVGETKVEQVASNRRYLGADGKPRFGRTSSTPDAGIRAEPEGTIDPWLKTLSFWDGSDPVLAISCYATHPMSYYGQGGVTSDFVGLARKRRQADHPKVFQIYVSGCSGNVTAGKYNDGAPANRPLLADRIYRGMADAWKTTQTKPITSPVFRSTKLRLEPRDGVGFTTKELEKRLAEDARPFGQCLAALGLSWRKRADAGAAIDVPCLDFGNAAFVLLPAESYVEYQLMAQKLRPRDFVMVMGYGECAPGYIPTEQAVRENDSNLSDWSWVARGAEDRMRKALEKVLK